MRNWPGLLQKFESMGLPMYNLSKEFYILGGLVGKALVELLFVPFF